MNKINFPEGFESIKVGFWTDDDTQLYANINKELNRLIENIKQKIRSTNEEQYTEFGFYEDTILVVRANKDHAFKYVFTFAVCEKLMVKHYNNIKL